MFGTAIYRELGRHPEQLPQQIVAIAANLFADTSKGLSGPNIFEFFSRYSEEIAGMRYGQGVPSKRVMFINFLESLPADKQRRALLDLCGSYKHLRTTPQPNEVRRLRALLKRLPYPKPSTMLSPQWTLSPSRAAGPKLLNAYTATQEAQLRQHAR